MRYVANVFHIKHFCICRYSRQLSLLICSQVIVFKLNSVYSLYHWLVYGFMEIKVFWEELSFFNNGIELSHFKRCLWYSFSPYGLVTPVKIVSKVFRIHIAWLVVEAFCLNDWVLNEFVPAHGSSSHWGQWLVSAGAKLFPMHKLVVVSCE